MQPSSVCGRPPFQKFDWTEIGSSLLRIPFVLEELASSSRRFDFEGVLSKLASVFSFTTNVRKWWLVTQW